MSQGLILERIHPIVAFVPIDTTGAGRDGDWINLKKARRIAGIIMMGAWAGGTPAVTWEQASDNSGTGAKALSFAEHWHGVALTTDVMTKVAVASDTFNLAATANKIYAMEVHATHLDMANGFSHVRMRVASPGSNADLIAGLYLVGSMFFEAAPDRLQTKID